MTTITYKNIHNYKFNEIKKIVESELGFNNDFIEKNTNKEIIYRFKHEGEYLNIYNGLHGLPVKKHIIFYRKLNSKMVEITRVLQGKMDIKSKIR